MTKTYYEIVSVFENIVNIDIVIIHRQFSFGFDLLSEFLQESFFY